MTPATRGMLCVIHKVTAVASLDHVDRSFTTYIPATVYRVKDGLALAAKLRDGRILDLGTSECPRWEVVSALPKGAPVLAKLPQGWETRDEAKDAIRPFLPSNYFARP